MTILVYANETNPQWLSTHAVLEEMNIDHELRDITALIDEPAVPKEMIVMAKAHQPIVITDDDHWWGYFPNKLRAIAAKHQKPAQSDKQ